MALVGSKVKQPREIYPIDIGYADVIAGRTVDSITPTVEVPSGMTKDDEILSGEVLQVFVAGGTDGQSYRWTVLCDIVIGGKLTRVEDEFDIVVEEV